MSSIRNITASSAVPDDLAKRLGPSGVNEILLALWQGYHDIIADTSITITENTEEDDITQEWYGKISLRWTSENRATILRITSIGPVHQYQDPTLKKRRGYKPTIDFCFRDWDTSNSYFGAECKNLYNHKKDKIHYAMPLRIMQGDVMLYMKEFEEIKKENREQKTYSSKDEFLSWPRRIPSPLSFSVGGGMNPLQDNLFL